MGAIGPQQNHYQVVVPTRDILLRHKDTWPAISRVAGMGRYLEELISHTNEDIDSSPEALDQYLAEHWDNEYGLSNQPPPLLPEGRRAVAVVMSDLFTRIVSVSSSLFISIPRGFVYEVRIAHWAGLDMILEFHFTQGSYSVSRSV
jgi:hypothetical protein